MMSTSIPKRPKIWVIFALASRGAVGSASMAYMGICQAHHDKPESATTLLTVVPLVVGVVSFLGALPVLYVGKVSPVVMALGTGFGTAMFAGLSAGWFAFWGALVIYNASHLWLRRWQVVTAAAVPSGAVPAVIRRLAGVAAALAGQRWAGSYAEWMGDLASDTRTGQPMGRCAQTRFVVGLFRAAVRMRLGDFARWVGRGLDWLLATRERIFAAASVAVGSTVVALIVQGGVTSAVGYAQQLSEIGIGIWGAALLLRQIRRVSNRRVRLQPKPDPVPPAPSAATRSRPQAQPGRRRKGAARRRRRSKL